MVYFRRFSHQSKHRHHFCSILVKTQEKSQTVFHESQGFEICTEINMDLAALDVVRWVVVPVGNICDDNFRGMMN